MPLVRTFPHILVLSTVAIVVPITACEKKAEAPAATEANASSLPKGDQSNHANGQRPSEQAGGTRDDYGHASDAVLGTAAIGAWTVKASGEIQAGKEAHLDIELSGSAEKPIAVRVWIGTRDGKGTMKSKADGEGLEFHAHADVPNPIPAEAQLWIEIEDVKGGKFLGSISLKP